MNPALRSLTELESPPAGPVAPGTPAAWSEVERELQVQLPSDYKAYIGVYGAGRWADFLGIMDPFYQWQHPQAQGFFTWMRTRLDGLDEMHERFPEYAPPFRRHPAPGGLLPIGYTDNGGTICWQTSGAPDAWGIVCLAGKYADGYDRYETTLTGFLLALLRQEIRPRTFPTDFFPFERPAFRRYTTQ